MYELRNVNYSKLKSYYEVLEIPILKLIDLRAVQVYIAFIGVFANGI